MESPRPPSALSIRGWSIIVGATKSKIDDLLVENIVNVVAAAGLVLLFAAPQFPARLVGALLSVAALCLVAWLLRRERGRKGTLLLAYGGVRLLLLVAVAGGYLLRRPEDGRWIWLATGLAVLAVLSEPTIQILLTKTEQVAVNLPGVRPVPGPPFDPDLLAVVTLVEVLVGAVLATARAPGAAYLIATVLGLLASATMAGHAVRANLISKRSAAGVRPALERYQPAFVVYFGGAHGARYQLGMWLPYLERLNLPFMVITRNAETVPDITSLTRAPVVVPKQSSVLANLDQMVVGSLKASFYVQGNQSNQTFQRNRQLTHIWLNHGDSDKVANFSARHGTYDRIFVSGQQGIERYAAHGVNLPAERFAIVGRPQIERIELRDERLPLGRPRTVLYAPTWRGGRPATDYSSLRLGDKIVAALLKRGSTVIFRPHPLSYTDPHDVALIRQIQHRLADDKRTNGRQHVWGQQAEKDWDIPACINASDALVTDVSSVASDYLASGKPLAMVAIRATGDKFRQEFPMARVSYVIEKNLSTLDTALDALQGDDPLAEARRAYRRHCLGDHLGAQAADEFLRVAHEIISSRP
jgi:hypothetical protein